MEHRALERAQQVRSEGQRQDLVGREGHVAQPEGFEKAVEDAAVALLGDDRKAGVLQGVEIAIDRAPHAAERLGQRVEVHAAAAVREALDQQPLARELVAPHAASR